VHQAEDQEHDPQPARLASLCWTSRGHCSIAPNRQ
jgi:hypothetical protein